MLSYISVFWGTCPAQSPPLSEDRACEDVGNHFHDSVKLYDKGKGILLMS